VPLSVTQARQVRAPRRGGFDAFFEPLLGKIYGVGQIVVVAITLYGATGNPNALLVATRHSSIIVV
jgi:hypothetical protein